MFYISYGEFESIVHDSISIFAKTKPEINRNIAFLIEETPNQQQRKKLQLLPNQTLFGLYEGLPLSRRLGQTKTLPDKITIFKNPIEQSVNSLEELKEQVKHTLWHEIAHYYGLNHEDINKKEG